MRDLRLILTCEHAGNEVPKEYNQLFLEAGPVLNSHRGFDPGALDLFNHLRKLAFFEKFHMVTRLLVETNRSLHHPQLFSEWSKDLSEGEKKELLEDYYFPYRSSVEDEVRKTISEGNEALHLSVHTFTPVLNGQVRKADVGLLYDPARVGEKKFCKTLQQKVNSYDPELRVRFNYPYRGTDDGFTTFLRKKFPQHYLGVEIEVNQKFVVANNFPSSLKDVIFKALSEILFQQDI